VRDGLSRGRAWVGRLLLADDGATAVEYALMLALIALVVVGAVTYLGQSTSSQFANSALRNTLGS
jgi:pilus assembly protein Flp/PilA